MCQRYAGRTTAAVAMTAARTYPKRARARARSPVSVVLSLTRRVPGGGKHPALAERREKWKSQVEKLARNTPRVRASSLMARPACSTARPGSAHASSLRSVTNRSVAKNATVPRKVRTITRRAAFRRAPGSGGCFRMIPTPGGGARRQRRSLILPSTRPRQPRSPSPPSGVARRPSRTQ